MTEETPLIVLTDPRPLNFTISNGHEEVVTIDLKTGKVTFGEGYEPDLAGKIFWEALARENPEVLKQEITDLKEEIARLKKKIHGFIMDKKIKVSE